MEMTALRLYGDSTADNLSLTATISTNIPLVSGTLSNLLLGTTDNVCRFDTSTTMTEGFIEIVLGSVADVKTLYVGSGDVEDYYPWAAMVEAWNTVTSRWELIANVTNATRKALRWQGPRELGFTSSGNSNGALFFDSSVVPATATVNADGTIVTKTVTNKYEVFTGSQPFAAGTNYYFEVENTGGFFGFASTSNLYLPDYYIGQNSQIPGSVGFGPDFNYMNYSNSAGTSASYVYVGGGITNGARVGVLVDTMNMFIRLYRNTSGTAFANMDLRYLAIDPGDSLVLALSHNATNVPYTVQYFIKEADLLYPVPSGAVVGMGKPTPSKTTTISERGISLPGIFTQATGQTENIPVYPLMRDLNAELRNRTISYAGWGYIKATVKVQGSPNYPVVRRVVLFQVNSDVAIRDAISDPITGEFEFKYLDMTKEYIVTAMDTTGGYIVTSSGPVRPKRMPGTEGFA